MIIILIKDNTQVNLKMDSLVDLDYINHFKNKNNIKDKLKIKKNMVMEYINKVKAYNNLLYNIKDNL